MLQKRKASNFFPRCICSTSYSSNLTVRTLTCNKLSHCLFDFDCPDLSCYEHEKYQFVEFKYDKLTSNMQTGVSETICDRVMLRDRNGINVQCLEADKINPKTEYQFSD